MASFADYVKDLMGVLPKVNGNPMLSVTSMTDDNARYREDPFYKSRDIQVRDQLALDEEERKRREAAQAGLGMMTGGSDSPQVRNAIQEREQTIYKQEQRRKAFLWNSLYMSLISVCVGILWWMVLLFIDLKGN